MTTGAGSSQNRDGDKQREYGKKPYEARGKKEYKPRNEQGDRENKSSDRPRGEYKPRGDFKPREDRQKGEYKPRGDYKQKNDNQSYRQNNNFSKGFDKDKDEEQTPVRRSKASSKDNKPKEQQSDKFDIINRLEKEKKAMKKKQAEKKEQKPAKHQIKPKRSGNIDWTRAYENDSYDDDDLDMYI